MEKLLYQLDELKNKQRNRKATENSFVQSRARRHQTCLRVRTPPPIGKPQQIKRTKSKRSSS